MLEWMYSFRNHSFVWSGRRIWDLNHWYPIIFVEKDRESPSDIAIQNWSWDLAWGECFVTKLWRLTVYYVVWVRATGNYLLIMIESSISGYNFQNLSVIVVMKQFIQTQPFPRDWCSTMWDMIEDMNSVGRTACWKLQWCEVDPQTCGNGWSLLIP
jgi:hypothetical protein